MAASHVSAASGVRRVLVRMQQELGRRSGGVLEGRDIGTKVFPETPHKFFLTARPEVRAQRRYAELTAKGQPADYDTVLAESVRRDEQDSTRADSPLSFDEDFDLVAPLDLHLAVVAGDFGRGQQPLGLVPDIDDDVGRRDFHHLPANDLALGQRRFAVEVEKLVHAEVLQIAGVRLTRFVGLLGLVTGRHVLRDPLENS